MQQHGMCYGWEEQLHEVYNMMWLSFPF